MTTKLTMYRFETESCVDEYKEIFDCICIALDTLWDVVFMFLTGLVGMQTVVSRFL